MTEEYIATLKCAYTGDMLARVRVSVECPDETPRVTRYSLARREALRQLKNSDRWLHDHALTVGRLLTATRVCLHKVGTHRRACHD